MSDEIFFQEWHRKGPSCLRSLKRARMLAERLGIAEPPIPILAVVGSKGKGTTATYASACLVAAGLRVVTVTGPSFRSQRERIRVDGAALSEATFADLAGRMRTAIKLLPASGREYLAPTGLFTLAAVVHAMDVSADVLVIEAGMGGASDELSLFAPALVAMSRIFGEHLGKLADTVPGIAREKAAVTAATTQAVLSLPQAAEVRNAIEETVSTRTDGACPVTTITPGQTGIPTAGLPDGLSRQNGELGCMAGLRMLEILNVPLPQPRSLSAMLETINLPARLSWHNVPGTESRILVDSAIERRGVATALATATARWGRIDHVLICLPDDKDVAGAISEVGDLPTTFVRIPYERLKFDHALPEEWRVIEAESLTPATIADLGQRIVALGTGSFTGHVLDVLDADTERLFAPPVP